MGTNTSSNSQYFVIVDNMALTKRQVYILIGFVIILVAIPVTIYLVRQTQIFKPKAVFIPKVEFVDASGKVITQTTSPNVKLRITKEVATQPVSGPIVLLQR